MNEEYPDGYWENKYNKKTKLQKVWHAYKFAYRSRGLLGVLGYFWSMLYLYTLMTISRIKHNVKDKKDNV